MRGHSNNDGYRYKNIVSYAKIEMKVKKTYELRRFEIQTCSLNIDSFRKSDSWRSQSFDEHIAIGTDFIFLALRSDQKYVSYFQAKQPGCRYDAVHQELTYSQSCPQFEQGGGQVSLYQATYVFC